MSTERLTNAILARELSSLTSQLSMEVAELAYGMWNPNFCAAEVSEQRVSQIIEQTRARLRWIEGWNARNSAICAPQQNAVTPESGDGT